MISAAESDEKRPLEFHRSVQGGLQRDSLRDHDALKAARERTHPMCYAYGLCVLARVDLLSAVEKREGEEEARRSLMMDLPRARDRQR
jgi:hypothetical protein